MDNFDIFFKVFIDALSVESGMPIKYILCGMELTYATGFQRHYTQTGPWADMLSEGR